MYRLFQGDFMTDLNDKQAAASFSTAASDWLSYKEAYRGVQRFELGADFALDAFVKSHLSPESLTRLGAQAIAVTQHETQQALANAPNKYKQDGTREGAVAVFSLELETLEKAKAGLSPQDFGVALAARLIARAEGQFGEQAVRLREKLDKRFDVKTALANTRATGIDLYFNFVWMDDEGHSRINNSARIASRLQGVSKI